MLGMCNVHIVENDMSSSHCKRKTAIEVLGLQPSFSSTLPLQVVYMYILSIYHYVCR